jgi:hypothetical protein
VIGVIQLVRHVPTDTCVLKNLASTSGSKVVLVVPIALVEFSISVRQELSELKKEQHHKQTDAQPALLATTAYLEQNTLCLFRVHQERTVPRALLKLLVQLEHSALLYLVKL